MSITRYALGCPFWSFDEWNGGLYSRDARPADRLRQYAGVFNAVEGNTTFWSVPSPRNVERWRAAVPRGFEFCLKLPREITHERFLRGCQAELEEFLRVLEPLQDRLGPFLLQLPPVFGPSRLDDLWAFLDTTPTGLGWAVELRHRAFFEDEAAARDVDARLRERGCDRVMMDTRALRAGDPKHPEVVAALHEKPNLPLRPDAIGSRPMLRLVGHPVDATNDPYLEEWAQRIARWISEGRRPIVFVHTASNRHTPEVARDLHQRIGSRIEVGTLPEFPGEKGEGADGQLALL